MLILTGANDLLQVVTGSAGTVVVHASYVDNNAGTITPNRTNTPTISTNTTTTVVAAPGVGVQRNVKKLNINNTSATVANLVTIQHTDGTNVIPLWDGTLAAGESVEMDEDGIFTYYDASGRPWSNLTSTIRNYCGTSGGSANAQTLTPPVAVISYATSIGQSFPFVAVATNTTAMTIAISGLAALNTTMGIVALPVGGVVIGRNYVALIESATSIRVTPFDTMSVDGDTLNGTVTFATGTTAMAPIVLPAGVLLTNAIAGGQEADGAANYATINTTNGRAYDDAWNYFRLAANGTAFVAATITDFFGTNDGIPTVLNGVYEIEWHCFFSTAAIGSTMLWTIVNTQAVTNMVANWESCPVAGIATAGTPQRAGVVTQTAASVALPISAALTITTNQYFCIRATIEAATAGNVRLRGTTGSTMTITPLRDSYFKVRRLPAGNAGTFLA